MASGYMIGEAYIRIFPNAKNFHNKLKSEVQRESKGIDVNIPVELEDEKFKKQWDEFKRRIKAEAEKTSAQIKLELDTKKAQRQVEQFMREIKKRDARIDLSVNFQKESLEKAGEKIERFKKKHEKLRTAVQVNTARASKELSAWRRSEAGKAVVQTVITKHVGAKVPVANPFAGAAKNAQQEALNALNFVPRLLAKANEQFDAGIRQIYDPYVHFAESMYKAGLKPFQLFRDQVWNNSKTIEEFLEKTKIAALLAWDKMFPKDKVKQATDFITAQFDTARVKVSNIWEAIFKRGPPKMDWLKNLGGGAIDGLKGKLAGIKDVFKSGNFQILPNFDVSLKTLEGQLKSFVSNVTGSVSGAISTLGSKTTAAFTNIGNKAGNLLTPIKTKLTAAIAPISGQITTALAPVTTKIRSMFGRGLIQARHLIPDLGPAAARAQRAFTTLGVVGRAAFKPVSLLGRGIRGSFHAATSGAGMLARGLQSVTKRFASFAFRSTAVFSVLKRGFRRVGDYAIGGMRVAIGMFMKIGGILLQAIMPALGAIAAGFAALGGQALIGTVLALGGAVASVATAAAALAPAFLAAAGVSFAALKIGLEGVKEGVKAAFSAETAEEFEKAIEKLPPAAQNIARAFREFQPQIKAMKEAVQNNLLADLGPGIQSAMNNLLPTFSTGLQNIATQWNGALKMAFAELSSPRAQSGLAAVMDGANQMAANMQPVISNLLAAAGSLAEQGSKYLGSIGTAISNMTAGWVEKVESLKQVDASTGLSKFDTIIQNAKTNLGFLKQILDGLFGTLGNLLKAAEVGGGGFLNMMATALQSLKAATAEGTEGFKNIVTFMQASASAASLLGQAIGPVLSIVAQVAAALATVAATAMPGVLAVLEAVKTAIQPIFDVAGKVGTALGEALQAVAPAISQLGAAIAPLLEGLALGIKAMFEAVGPALTSLIASVGPAMEALKPVFETVGKALGDIFAALGPILESTVNMIKAFSPILDQIFKYIGEIATEIINGLAPLFTGHDSVLIKFVDALKPLVDVLGQGLLSAIQALQPAIPPVIDAFNKILESLMPLMPTITDVVRVIVDGLVTALRDWLVPIFVLVVKNIMAFALPIIDYLVPILKVLIQIVIGVADVLISAFSTAMKFIMPLIQAVGAVIQWLGDIIDRVIKTFIAPIIEGFKTHIQEVFGVIISLIKGDFSGALDHLKNIFKNVVDTIKTIWEKLKEYFGTPIKFFIDVVVNKAIVDGWNWVSDKFLGGKLPKLEHMPYPSGLKFATGGILPGYTPGRDPHKFYSPTGGSIALSGGEAILRPEATRAFGPKSIDAINKAARLHGVNGVKRMIGEGAQYKKGGIVGEAALDSKIHHVLEELKPEHGKPYQYGGTGNPSWDCSGLWSGIVQALNGGSLRGGRIFNTESRFENFGFEPGLKGRVTIGVLSGKGGGENGHMAGTIDGMNLESSGDNGVQIGGRARGSDNSLFNHTYTLTEFLGKFVSGGGGGASFLSILISGVKKFLDGLIKPIKDKMTGDGEHGSGVFGRLIPGIAEKLFDGVIEFIMSKLPEFAPAGDSGGGGGGDVEHYRPLVEHILESKGLPKSLANSLLRRMNQESSGNPRAVNGWDSNAAAGNPSKGLMQVIDPTFQAYKDPGYDDIWDPESNIRASINYAIARYGSLPAAYDRAGGYDSGGEAKGVGYMPKYTLRPERVLSPGQTKAFNRFVYDFLPELIQSYKKDPKRIQNAVKDITKELRIINTNLLKERDKRIDKWSEWVAEDFRQQEKGTKKLNKIDMSIFNEKWWKNNTKDGDPDKLINALEKYADKNGDKIKTNVNKAAKDVGTVLEDPHGYLKAEEVARERVEKEKEEAEKKAEEERQDKEREAQRDAQELKSDQRREENKKKKEERAEERKKKNEKKKKELKAAKTDAEKKAIEARYKKEEEDASDAEYEARKQEKREEQHQKDLDKKEQKKLKEQQKERDKKLQEEINKKKESGEYYYGYKVLKEDGSNPDAYKESDNDKFASDTGDAVAGKFDLSGITQKLRNRFQQGKQLEAGINLALPSWYAALNGDTSGLRHNVAAASAMTYDEAESNLRSYGPEALAGLLEFGLSGASTRRATSAGPLIQNAYLGMTQAEMIQGLSKYDAMRARRGSGTRR